MVHSMLAFLGLPGGAEWIVILIVAVLVFGGRLPEIARRIGIGITEFKKGIKDVEKDIRASDESGPNTGETSRTERSTQEGPAGHPLRKQE